MRRKGALGAALAAALLTAPAQAAISDPHVPGEVIVQFAPGASGAEREQARDDARTEVVEGLGARGLQLVEATGEAGVAATIRALEADPAVRFAEPNLIEQPSAIPDDAAFGDLWGLHNTGQNVNGTVGTADADIDAPEAWDIGTGSADTVIAVIDTGIDPTHPDLAANLWHNPGEVAGNGVDDDANGFVDDVNGYDFVGTGDADPFDAVGHGTHVSGSVAAAGGNGAGISGVSQQAQLMSLRVCSVSGCTVADQTEAINYAAANGARVLNGSLGGFSATESAARRAAIFSHPEVLHVFAAGNEGANADDSPARCGGASPCRSYPCAHAPQGGETDNVLCVAATNQNDAKPGFSNFGATAVDLGAPGTNIRSTGAERTYLDEDFESAAAHAARWDPFPGDDADWPRVAEAPLATNGITDSPGGDYTVSTTYGTVTTPIPVGAVQERGCTAGYARAIDLGAADVFQAILRRNGAAHAGQTYEDGDADDNTAGTDTIATPVPPSAGTLQISFRLFSDAAGVDDGAHVDNVSLECGETPGPHDYVFKSGTSMASPQVAGAAGLLISRNPAASTTEVRDKLLQNVDPLGALAGVTTAGGRLNVGTAMARMPADTAITSGPGEGEEIGARRGDRGIVTKGATATFGLSSNDPSAGFQCSVDGGAFAACGAGGVASVGALGPGSHSFSARSVDPRGNADATPVTRSFAVEGDPPETSIVKGPKKRTKKKKAKFRFASDEPGSTFECKIDRKRFTTCSSPRKLKRVKPGRHRFLVRATDAVGNLDATAAKKRWRVKPKRKR